jgi:hypothetical protein
LAFFHFSLIPSVHGFNQKTPQGKNQQAQTAQETALESSQEAPLAEVISAVRFIIRLRATRAFAAVRRRALSRVARQISADETSV